MKNLMYPLFTFILFTIYLPAMAQDSTKSMLIVINGEIESGGELKKIPRDEIKTMHYLSSRDARNLYGMAGANGALLVKTKKNKKNRQPIVLKDGKRIPADSLEGTSFTRIDVIRGKQALNLYGPAGKDGVFIVHAPDELINVFLEIVNERGKPVNGAIIKNSEGKILATANRCGTAYLENFSSGNNVKISGKKYQTQNVDIKGKKVKVVLGKN